MDDTHRLAFAAGTASVVFYLAGALIAAIFPLHTLQMWMPLCYTANETLLPFFSIAIKSLLSGSLQMFLYTYLYVWVVARVYQFLLPTEL